MSVLRREMGDTIIEVMLAFTVFALLAVGSLTIMNQGVASAQNALETTLVRQQIDGQAETLRFLQQAYMSNPSSTSSSVSTFKSILDSRKVLTPSSFNTEGCISNIPAERPFVLSPESGRILVVAPRPMATTNAPAYAQLSVADGTLTSYGLWVEAVEGENTTGQPPFIDFHIRACWSAATGDVPRTLGTIVRLYVQ